MTRRQTPLPGPTAPFTREATGRLHRPMPAALGRRLLPVAALAGLLGLGACQTDGTSAGLTSTSGSTSPTAPPTLRRDSNVDAPLPQGFLCCNLHHEGDWISDSNYASLPLIAVGTPARAIGYGNNRFSAEIGGRRMRVGLDYGRKEPLPQFAAKLIVPTDPKVRIAGFPADIQRAITEGRLKEGMSREQVIMAVGYPQTDENPDPQAPVSRYWVDWENEYQVSWDAEGRVKALSGTASALARIRAR